MKECLGNNLSGIGNYDEGFGAGQVSIAVPGAQVKPTSTAPINPVYMLPPKALPAYKKKPEELKRIFQEQLNIIFKNISNDRKKAIQNAKIAIAKERKADIEATLATYQAEINKRFAELDNNLKSGFEESRLARIKIVTDRDLKSKILQDKILKDRAAAMEIAAKAAKAEREEIINMFNLKIKTVSATLHDEQNAYQAKNEAALTKQKVDILAEREIALKTAVAEAKMARDVILKDMQSNLKTQLDLIKMERKEVIESLKKEFADAISAASTAREELEARRMTSMQEAKAEMLVARQKAISDLYKAVEIERNKIKAEAINYMNKTISELKALSEQLINDAKVESRSGIAALKTERQKAMEQTRLQMVNEREVALKSAAEERGKIEKSIGVLEKERTARIKADEEVKAKRKEVMRKAVHPMAILARYWARKPEMAK